MRDILVTADDLGLTQGVTDSILETADAGVVRAVSILANGEATEYALGEYLKRKDHLQLFVHLNLTDGRPVSALSAVPLLLNAKGMFRYSVGGLLIRYVFLSSSRRAELREQIRRELSAQYALVRDGIEGVGKINGVNGHQHVHMVPFVFDVIVALPTISSIRIPREPFHIPAVGSLLSIGTRIPGWIALMIFSKRNRARVLPDRITTDYFAGALYSGRMSFASTWAALRKFTAIRTPFSVELLFHPWLATQAELERWSGKPVASMWYSRQRGQEHALVLSGECRTLIQDFSEGRPSSADAGISKIFRFLISGTLAAFVNLTALYVLTSLLGVWYMYSLVLSFLVAFAVSFTLQKFWTFQDTAVHQADRQLIQFLLLQILNLAVNAIAVYVLVEYVQVWYLSAQFLTLIAIAAWTFLASHFIFNIDSKNQT